MALIDWININLPAFRRPDNATLWVSKIDGTDKKALGVIQNANSQDTSTLKWTPDGKSLSFLFKSQLYQVSTE